MTRGNFFIDYKNSFDHYGILIAEKGYTDIATPAPLKSIDFNDWPEEDGIEPDLSAPVLDARTISIPFVCVDKTKVTNFFAQLSGAGYHTFDFAEINETLNLRFLSESRVKRIGNGETFKLTFSDDQQLSNFDYQPPKPQLAAPEGYALDSVILSEYGINVSYDAEAELRRSAQVKKNNTIYSRYAPGVIYDTGVTYFKQADKRLHVLFRATNAENFWLNYKAFLYNLIRPGVRTLTTPLGNFQCYYKQGKARRFETLTNGGIWCELDMTLTFISFRL